MANNNGLWKTFDWCPPPESTVWRKLLNLNDFCNSILERTNKKTNKFGFQQGFFYFRLSFHQKLELDKFLIAMVIVTKFYQRRHLVCPKVNFHIIRLSAEFPFVARVRLFARGPLLESDGTSQNID